GDAFIAKLSPDGSYLMYATYLGGSFGCSQGSDEGLGIAVDGKGAAYVTGYTESCDFPIHNALQPVFGGGLSDAFVTKLSTAGNALVYSTFLGGTTIDMGYDVAVDPSGAASLIGHTNGSFPVVNALQPTYAGQGDCFVAKVSPSGAALVYSTYLGGA